MSGWEPVEFTSERLILKRIHQQAHAEEIHAAIMETIDSVDQWVTWMKPSLTVEVKKSFTNSFFYFGSFLGSKFPLSPYHIVAVI